MKRIGLILILIISFSGIIYAEDDVFNEEDIFSEEGLFSEEEMIVEEEELVSDDVTEELDQKSVGISGEIKTETTYINYSAKDDWTGQGSGDKNKLRNKIRGDTFFDVRLQNGVKSFLSLELSYFPEGIEETDTIYLNGEEVSITTTKYTDVGINEFFVDTNWKNKVYFRTGKQVLKWGRSYFWNPTDLINLEKKDFLEMDSTRKGSYGSKVHIPFGAEKNLYFFTGMNDVEEIEQISLSGKYEFLVGNTEMSLSAWNKKDCEVVYGFDISSRISDIDLRGEISVAAGDNNSKMDYDTLNLVTEDDSVIRASAGFTKYFDYGEINDRISLTAEAYYNGNGYEDNIFKKIEKEGTVNDRLDFLSEVYQPYSNNKYYLALFNTVDRFIVRDATLNLNGMMNLVDKSATVTAGVSYNPITDVTLDLNINGYFGNENTEATLLGNTSSISLSTKILF